MFLVVIRLLTHGDFLFPNPLHQLAVHMMPCWVGRRRSLLEYLAHVVEKAGGRQQYRRRLILVQSVQKKLRVLMSL